MAKKAMIERNNRAFIRKFGLCRVCFREMSLRGEIPGVRKSSW